MTSIDDSRWEEANKAEKQSWLDTLSTDAGIRYIDIFGRHKPVMFLPEFFVEPMNVVDIGGGPISIMLKYDNIHGLVVDPILFPEKWIDNYKKHNIKYFALMAEEFLTYYDGKKFDEVWIYNVLQHVKDPDYILDNLWKVSNVLRISEPCNTPVDLWHPHTFTPEWYKNKLESISLVSEWKRVDYDYPYVGGYYNLRSK